MQRLSVIVNVRRRLPLRFGARGSCSDSFDSYAFHVFQMNESLRRNQSDWQERTKRAEVKAAVLEKQKDAEIQDLKVCLCSRYSFTWQV